MLACDRMFASQFAGLDSIQKQEGEFLGGGGKFSASDRQVDKNDVHLWQFIQPSRQTTKAEQSILSSLGHLDLGYLTPLIIK